MATNVRLSGAQTSPRSEADIRLNYTDPTKIIAASNSISAAGTQAQFFSSDSGVTWKQTTCPDGTTSNNDGGTCLNHLTP